MEWISQFRSSSILLALKDFYKLDSDLPRGIEVTSFLLDLTTAVKPEEGPGQATLLLLDLILESKCTVCIKGDVLLVIEQAESGFDLDLPDAPFTPVLQLDEVRQLIDACKLWNRGPGHREGRCKRVQ